MPDFTVIATWRFGRTAVKTAVPLLAVGKPALDAAIAGAQAVEDDPAVDSVGYGGMPNAVGTVQLDACVMDGHSLGCGAVGAVENIRHPAALARRVMEKTPHVYLMGDGARAFALQQGFPLDNLQTPETLAKWMKTRPKDNKPAPPNVPPDSGVAGAGVFGSPGFGHDTVTVLALDKKGSLAGVCTTSGLAYKLPGRVGDSPIIGTGLYVDNSAGAAGATGVGEEIIRTGGSILIVEAMRAGKSPQEACETAVRRVNAAALRRGVHVARVAFLALNPKGDYGAACTAQTNFQFAVGKGDNIELLKAKEIGIEEK